MPAKADEALGRSQWLLLGEYTHERLGLIWAIME